MRPLVTVQSANLVTFWSFALGFSGTMSQFIKATELKLPPSSKRLIGPNKSHLEKVLPSIVRLIGSAKSVRLIRFATNSSSSGLMASVSALQFRTALARIHKKRTHATPTDRNAATSAASKLEKNHPIGPNCEIHSEYVDSHPPITPIAELPPRAT